MIHGSPTPKSRRGREPDRAQRSFAHLREQELGSTVPLASARRHAHERTLAGVDDRGSGSISVVRDEAIRRLKCELVGFLKRLGLGQKVTGVDFTNWLERCGLRPDPRVLDLRCTGGWWRTLMHAGVLSLLGYAPNGGGEGTGYSSTVRPVYRVDRLPTLADLDKASLVIPVDTDPDRRPAA